MKKLTTLITIILFAGNLIAQPTIKEWEPFNSKSDDYRFVSSIGADESCFYNIAIHKDEKEKQYRLERRDKQTGQLLSEQRLDNEPYYYYIYNKKIIVLYSILDLTTRKRNFSYTFFDPSDFKKIKEKEIETVDAEVDGPHSMNYSISLSPDKSKILLVANNSKLKFLKNKLRLYDSDQMTEIWKRDFVGKYATKEYKVDNAGNVVFAKYNTIADTLSIDRDKGVVNLGNQFEICKSIGVIPYQTPTLSFITLSLGDNNFLTNPVYKFTANGMIQVAGVYKNISKKDKTHEATSAGIFYASMNIAKLTIDKQVTENFTPDMKTKLTWKDGDVKKEAENKDYQALDIIEKDGAQYLIMEHFFEDDVVRKTQYVSHHHKELIISKVNVTTNKIEWTKILPKQTESAHGVKDYIVYSKNSTLSILYLDAHNNTDKYTVDNFDANNLKENNSIGGDNFISVSIDASGKATRTVLHDYKTFCVAMLDKSIPLDDKSFLLFLALKSTEKFGVVKFD